MTELRVAETLISLVHIDDLDIWHRFDYDSTLILRAGAAAVPTLHFYKLLLIAYGRFQPYSRGNQIIFVGCV